MNEGQNPALSKESVGDILRLLEERGAIPEGAASRALAGYEEPKGETGRHLSRIRIGGARLFAFSSLRRALEEKTGRPVPYPSNGLEGVLDIEFERTKNGDVRFKLSGKSDYLPESYCNRLPAMTFCSDPKGEALLETVKQSLGYGARAETARRPAVPPQQAIDSFQSEALKCLGGTSVPAPDMPHAKRLSRLVETGCSGIFLAARIPCDRSLFEGSKNKGAVFLEGVYDAKAGETVFQATLRDEMHEPRRLANLRIKELTRQSLEEAAREINTHLSKLMQARHVQTANEELARQNRPAVSKQDALFSLGQGASSARVALLSLERTRPPFCASLASTLLAMPSAAKGCMRKVLGSLLASHDSQSSNRARRPLYSLMERLCLAVEKKVQAAKPQAGNESLLSPHSPG